MDEYFERITAKEGAKKLSTITKVPVLNSKRAYFALRNNRYGKIAVSLNAIFTAF